MSDGVLNTASPAQKRRAHRALRIPHPTLVWTPDGRHGLLGMRSRTVMIRVAWTGRNYRVVPLVPIPRGTRIANDEFDDMERARRVAEGFFLQWLSLVGLSMADLIVSEEG